MVNDNPPKSETNQVTAAEGVLLSSQALNWPGLVVETRLHAGGEFHYSPSASPLISLHLGSPLDLERGESEKWLHRERVEEGMAIVVPAHQSSFWRHGEPSHFLNIQIAVGALERLAESMGVTENSLLSEMGRAAFHDAHLHHLATLLRWEMESGAPYGFLYAQTLAEALSVHLLQRNRGQSRFPMATVPAKPLRVEMRRAVEYIHDHLTDNLSIEALAGAAGLSPHHFAHLFAQALGIPPHRYVIQTRIERAKILLEREQLPPATVAQRVGFADQSHFTRHFKRLVGVTPGAFAAQGKRRPV